MAELKPFAGNLDAAPQAYDGPLDGEAPKPAGALRRAADTALALGRGIVAVPETAVGISDLITGGRTGKAVERLGVRFKDAKQVLTDFQSDEQKAADARVQQADGFLPTVGAMVENPSTIANAVAESVPSMLAGGAVSRGLVNKGVGGITAGAVGEGVVSAGQAAEQVRQEGPTGFLTPKQAALAATSGAATGVINRASGKLADKLGIGDVNTAMATGKLGGTTERGIAQRTAYGVINEGVLQELPQSMQEQAAQNLALDKPVGEGVAEAGAAGMLVGNLTGAAFGAVSREPQAPAIGVDAPDVGAVNQTTPQTGAIVSVQGGGIAPPQAPQNTAQNTPAAPPAPPPSKAQAMGINPAAGPLSAGAAIAVDTGADVITQTQEVEKQKAEAAAKEKAKPGADGKKPEPEAPAPVQPAPADPTAPITGPFTKAIHGAANVTPTPAPAVPPQGPATPEGVGAQPDAPAAPGVGADQGPQGAGAVPVAVPEPGNPALTPPPTQEIPNATQESIDPETGEITQSGAQGAGSDSGQRPADALDPGADAKVPQPAPDQPAAPTAASTPPEGKPAAPVEPVDLGAHTAATSPHNDRPEPTQAQKEAGNAKLGHIVMNGVGLSIENPEGSTRKSKPGSPVKWETTMKGGHYGYVKGSIGMDGDHVDTFIKPGTPLDFSGTVFVVDQIDPATGKPDEHKVMIGYQNGMAARQAYQGNYQPGWKGLKAITPMTWDEFKRWVKSEGTKAPLAAGKPAPDAPAATPQSAPTSAPSPDTTSSAVAPAGPAPAQTQAAAPSKTESVSPAAAGPSPDGTQATTKSNTLRVGTMPTNAEPVTIKDGVIFIGKYEALNFDTGEPVRIAPDANPMQIRKALADNKALGTHQKVFGGVAPVETPAITPDVNTAPVETAAPAKPVAKPTGGKNLRAAAYEKNPLLTFLAQHGLFHDKDKPGSQKAEFSPDKQVMVMGYGPVFRKTGMKPDLLTELAIEDGYLPPGADESQMVDLIRRAIGGERIAPMYAEGAAETEMQKRMQAIDDLRELDDNEAADLDPDIFAESNTSTEDAMRALGFTDQEIHDATAQGPRAPQEGRQGRGELDEAQATGPGEGAQGGPRAPPTAIEPEGLTTDAANTRAGDLIDRHRAEFAKTPSGMTATQFRDFQDRRSAADKTIAAEILKLAGNGDGLLLPWKSGASLIALHKDPRTEGAWRTTTFLPDMTPAGHMEFNTPMESAAFFRDSAKGKAPDVLTAPTRADVIAQQGRAENAQALDDKEQIDREAGAQTLTAQVAPEQRKDNTGDMFAVEKAQATIDKRNASGTKSEGPSLFDQPTESESADEPDRNGLRAADRYARDLASAAQELASQIYGDFNEADFDPAEVLPGLQAFAKDAGVPADELRQAVLKNLRASNMSRANLRKVEKALDPTKAPAETAPPATAAHKVGDLVKLTKPGVNGRVNIAGTITKILPDGRLEIRTQQDGYMTVAPSELGHKPTAAPATTATTRSRPRDTITFKTPIKGPSGSRLVSYTWQWRPMDVVDSRGEDRTVRISDWDKADINAETGREIVHQFVVSAPDGSTQTVSAETAIRLLGFAGDETAPFKSAASAAKTLARLRMQAYELDALAGQFTKDHDAVKAMRAPSPTSERNAEGWFEMGDARARQLEPGAMLPERLRTLTSAWRDNRLQERGWKSGEATKDMLGAQAADIDQRIKRAEKKLAALNDAPESATPPAKPGEVENFGQALPPARRNMAAKLDEALTNDDIANRPLSEIWPLAENEAIEDNFAAAVAHAARAEIPSKPRVAYKLKNWVTKVQALRELGARIVSGRVTRERFIELVPASLKDWLTKVMLLEQTSRDQWNRIEAVEERPDSFTYDASGKQVESPMVRVKIDGRSRWLTGDSGVEGGARGTLDGNKAGIMALLSNEAPEERMQFEVRQRRGGKVFVNKKGDSEYRALMEFDTAEDARKAITGQYDDLVAAWDAIKARDNITERDLRSAENRQRVGKDHRSGRDVTPDDFQSKFGFRGGEFGKWVQQGKGDKERQAILNSAYDALMDLANIAGIPPKAISLNGTLGIAFGSRGTGWASAHFEPSNLVINLTKTRGAGALAHEWFHGLDNYFSRMRRGGAEEKFTGGQTEYRNNNYITHRPEPMMVPKNVMGGRYLAPMTLGKLRATHEARKDKTDAYNPNNWQRDPKTPEGVRPEVEARFAALVDVLNESPMTKRARTLDGTKSGEGYWSRTLERAARAFESYVIAKMHDEGYHNDFLVNVKKSDETGKAGDRYPYLMAGEVKPIAEAFDALFDTLETTEDDAGNVAIREPDAPYETDLFGQPVPTPVGRPAPARPKGAGVRGNVQPATGVQDTPAPRGEYFANTLVGSEVSRELGASRITKPEHAAQATTYLYKSAVERLDGIVTDKNGKPLGIVGGFKGALSQASVYPATLMAEAVRIPGAAHIWFSHNHPSGNPQLSRADESLNQVLSDVFRGSGIEPMGLLAIGNGKFSFAGQSSGDMIVGDTIPDATSRISVPVIERTLAPGGNSGPMITSPAAAKQYARDFYAKAQKPGLMLMDAQNTVIAWVPITDVMTGELRGTGGLNSIYRAISQANAGSAIIVHGGELGYQSIPKKFPQVTPSENIAAALKKMDVRPLDSVDVTRPRSVAEDVGYVDKGPVFARGTKRTTGVHMDDAEAIIAQVREALPTAPPIIPLESIAQAPADLRKFIRDAGAQDDFEAAYHMGKIYVLPSNVGSTTRLQFLLAHHEIRHHGLASMLGPRKNAVMFAIHATNANVRAAAAEQVRKGYATSKVLATEEALADMPVSELVKLNGFDKIVAAVREWLRGAAMRLRRAGLGNVADAIEPSAWTDKDVAALVARAEGVSRGGAAKYATEGTVFGQDGDMPAFYSALTREINANTARAQPALGWASTMHGLVKAGKIKREELEWSGVLDWLKLQGGKVTREQLVQFLDANGVRVEEKVIGAQSSRDSYRAELRAMSRDELAARYEEETNADAVDEYGEDWNPESLIDELLEAPLDAMPGEADDGTKYSRYQLPGGANYREILLTLPTGYDKGAAAIEAEVRALGINKPMDDVSGRDLTEAGASKDLMSRYYALLQANPATDVYQSSHWAGHPNVLAHIRVNDRVDDSGARVLFVEELQSDWGQAGKKKGFSSGDTSARDAFKAFEADVRKRFREQVLAEATELKPERRESWADTMVRNSTVGHMATAIGEGDRAIQLQRAEMEEESAAGRMVPKAPFVGKTDAWLSLALKRIVKMAVDEGYDRVAFVNGEQSAERYDLSKQVDSLEWLTRPTGAKMVSIAIGSQPVQLIVSEDGKVVAAKGRGLEQADGKMLDEVLGKDAASQIMAGDKGQLSDLKVGGEGMKAFYDKIVPNTLKDVLRKVGGGSLTTASIPVEMNGVKAAGQVRPEQVGEGRWVLVGPDNQRANMMTYASRAEAMEDADTSESSGTVLAQTAFDITPAMREKVAGGLPLFARGGMDSVTETINTTAKTAGNTAAHYRGLGLQALGRRQITELYGDILPQLGAYNTLMAQMDADKNEAGAQADQIAQDWGKLKDERQLAELMHDATLAQMDPEKPLLRGDDPLTYDRLRDQFVALSPEARKVYVDARETYRTHHENVRQAIRDRIERSELRGQRKAELLQQMDDEFYKAIKGVYFPLARFGDYVVIVRDGTGKAVSVNRAETINEAEALQRSLRQAYPDMTVGKVLKSKEFNAGRDAVGRGFMQNLYEVLGKKEMDEKQRADLEDMLGQLYLSALPDLSWAKHGIHRKGTPGFSQDARRAFAQNTFHGARYLAKVRYSDLLENELSDAQKQVDTLADSEDFDSVKAQQVIDEMVKRHDAAMNPNGNALSTALTSLGFVFHLGLSPASAMVNLTQTALVAYPIMGAKWGFTKASTALLKASQQAAANRNDISSALSADEKRAYDEAVRSGVIDVTMAHDLAGISQGEDAKVSWKLRPVMRWASFLFHHAEKFNRQVTFVASYRLAREAGTAPAQAYEQAVKATYDGHFDYGQTNRPRMMQGNTARVLLLFKQYAQNMVYTLSRQAYLSMKGQNPYERAQARKALGGLLAMHAAAAGVLGLPMVSTLLAAASMLGGDDDEPWDAEVALRNMLADALGDQAADVLARGLSRLTPWDISGRVGLDKLILPDIQEGLEGQDLANSVMAAALGPVAGIGVSMFRGMQEITDGNWARGLEAMAPSLARGPLKALRYDTEGAIDKTGKPIVEDVGGFGIAGQALGFSPSEVRLATEAKSAVHQADARLAKRRSTLMRHYALAVIAGDQEGAADAREDILAFNEKNPQRRINPMQMARSVATRRKQIAESEGGVYLPKTRRDAMEAGRFGMP